MKWRLVQIKRSRERDSNDDLGDCDYAEETSDSKEGSASEDSYEGDEEDEREDVKEKQNLVETSGGSEEEKVNKKQLKRKARRIYLSNRNKKVKQEIKSLSEKLTSHTTKKRKRLSWRLNHCQKRVSFEV